MTFDIKVLPFDAQFEAKADEAILNAALRQNLYLRYGCKNGGCGTCKVRLLDGDIEETGPSFALPVAEREQGWILTCVSMPVDDCVIDVSDSELTEDEFRAGDQTADYESCLQEIEHLTADIRRLVLRLTDGRMPFVAGQFVNVSVPGTISHRSFSMANAPGDGSTIELIVKAIPGGLFSTWLEEQAQVGDRLWVHGPHGVLRVRRSHRNLLMIAGGSGMAPILAMLRTLAESGNTRPVRFFFGARTEKDLYLVDEINHLAGLMPLQFVPVLSESWPATWTGETGMVTDALRRLIDRSEPNDAYLCGPPPMIDSAMPLLADIGVRSRNIYFDAFAPTG